MAAYESVSWQHGDEVTSTKLNQMARNEEYINEKMIYGDLTVTPGDGTQKGPDGMTLGKFPIKRIECVSKYFDTNGVAQKVADIDVLIPKVFKEQPAVICSLKTNGFEGDVRVRLIHGMRSVTIRAAELHGVAKHLYGVVHVLFIGY